MPGNKRAIMARREQGFNSNMVNEKLPKYDALHDGNLRHFFESRKVQSHLYNSGMIDKSGRVVDLEKCKSKLYIIDQEFKHAEKAEYWRQKEEEEIRKRVQMKRHGALSKNRQDDKLNKIKEDRRIRQEIVAATRESAGGVPKPMSSTRGGQSSMSQSSMMSGGDGSKSSFFINCAIYIK
jgi:hypothetical protein